MITPKFILLFLCPVVLCAQSADQYIITSQGGTSAGETMEISWTIGDVITMTTQSAHGLVTQGFQQPELAVKEMTPSGEASFEAKVYPNPFSEELTLEVDNRGSTYRVEMIDMSGVMLWMKLSSNPVEVFSVGELPAGQYILRVTTTERFNPRVFEITRL